MRRRRACLSALSLGALLTLATGPTRAALPAEGEAIQTNDYSVDLHQGVVLSGARVVGLGGAFVAIAEGVEGSAMNPAATAARTPHSYSHFDYDLGVGLTFPSAIARTDFWNSGHSAELPKSTLGFLFFNLALDLQFGRWGLGLASDFQRYSLLRGEDPEMERQRDRLVGQIAIGHLQVAHAFADGQLLVGVGSRTSGFSVSNENDPELSARELFSTVGAGLEGGFVLRPNDWQVRVGAAYHAGFTTRAAPESTSFVLYQDDPVNRLYLPARVTLPWDVNVGVAFQLGPRPLNPRWVHPSIALGPMRRYLEWRAHERERRRRKLEASALISPEGEAERQQRLRRGYAELRAEEELDEQEGERVEVALDRKLRRRYADMSRLHLLVTTSLMVTGAAENAVGIESMLNRSVQRSGEGSSFSPHLGVETELVPHWLRLRGGSYLEPSRFRSNPNGARVHATFGFDQKLLSWTVFGAMPDDTAWRVSGSLDAGRSYLSWGIGIGVWR